MRNRTKTHSLSVARINHHLSFAKSSHSARHLSNDLSDVLEYPKAPIESRRAAGRDGRREGRGVTFPRVDETAKRPGDVRSGKSELRERNASWESHSLYHPHFHHRIFLRLNDSSYIPARLLKEPRASV